MSFLLINIYGDLPLMCTKIIVVDRLGSGVRLSAHFPKIANLVCRLGSGFRVVGRLGSEIRVSVSFPKKIPTWWVGYGQESGPRVVSRLRSGTRFTKQS